MASNKGRWVVRVDMAWQPKSSLEAVMRCVSRLMRLVRTHSWKPGGKKTVWRKGFIYKLEVYQWIPAKSAKGKRNAK
ncbi:hypothetical protein LCGC14_0552190 [marine sediment metagenome]|uniref:Uncharacterized protein n=1 Tax=marine sediment metagenome TaxID=412755 RepID=A0A0F9UAV8_9ZZZZ